MCREGGKYSIIDLKKKKNILKTVNRPHFIITKYALVEGVKQMSYQDYAQLRLFKELQKILSLTIELMGLYSPTFTPGHLPDRLTKGEMCRNQRCR